MAFCFSNRVKFLEYYHNSSHLEYGGSPEKAVKQAFVSKIDGYLKQTGKYLKNESKITFQDVEDCLVLVSSSFSTQTSYENQTKKAITNKFIYEAMNDFLKRQLEVYFIENPDEADQDCRAGADQQAQPGERGKDPPQPKEEAGRHRSTLPTGWKNLWTAAPRTSTSGKSTSWRATRRWAPANWAATRSSRPSSRCAAKS